MTGPTAAHQTMEVDRCIAATGPSSLDPPERRSSAIPRIALDGRVQIG